MDAYRRLDRLVCAASSWIAEVGYPASVQPARFLGLRKGWHFFRAEAPAATMAVGSAHLFLAFSAVSASAFRPFLRFPPGKKGKRQSTFSRFRHSTTP